jgi:hypothetical protein
MYINNYDLQCYTVTDELVQQLSQYISEEQGSVPNV